MASFFIPQFEGESFWVYFNRVQSELPFDYRDNLWEICEVIYSGLNAFTLDVVESMHNGEFRALTLGDAWDFYYWLAQDTYEWDMDTYSSHVQPNCDAPPLIFPNFDDMHSHTYDSYSSYHCMVYNDAPYAYTSNSHESYHDSPSLPIDDTCVRIPPLDSPKLTLDDLTPQLIDQFNELIDESTEELLGLECGGRAFLDLVVAIKGLVKKRDLLISRTSL